MYYINFHKHDSYSNIITPDSASTVNDYIDRAKELGHKMLFSTQHGGCQGYFELYNACKKNGIKFGIGAEAYWVKNRFEKDKTNNHIIILAKNNKGRRALNKILSEANINGFYYKPRIDIELIMSLPENDVVITTACLGFYGYEDWKSDINLFHNKFKDNFYLEIQSHSTPIQIEKNKELLNISKEKNIQLIAGVDSHYIYPKQYEDRESFLLSKGIKYEEENGWYMDYPDYDTLFNRFKEQNIFTDEEIKNAINNTNKFLEFEDIYFDDKNIKLPSMFPNKTQEEKNKILKDILNQEFKKKNIKQEDKEIYLKAIREEWKVIEETNMSDYFLLNYHIIKRGIELGGKITLTSRGSAPSFYICNLLGFTSIDRVKSPVQLYPERFATVDRIKAGSMFDIDFNLSNREAFIQAQREILGNDNSYFFSAYGKLKEKSAWKMFAKANGIEFEISNKITDYIDEYEKAKKYADEEEKEHINIENYIPKEYINIYNGSLKYQGIIDSISPSPCGFLLLQDNISEEIGLIKVKDEICANIEGNIADKMLYMKNDLLLVTVVDIIYKTFEKIGINPLTPDELIEKSNEKVWDIFKNGHTVCINQCEQPKTREKVMRYKPKNISELSAFVAGIRPSFQSMIEKLLNRESFSYGIEEFDNIIKTPEIPDSFILYQEQIMKILNYAGFEISECYSLIKAIAKKRVGIIEPIKEKFINGFINKTNSNMEKTLKVWEIIENAVGYGFNASHALSVALDALYGAYLKTYYPFEFYTTIIEIYTQKKDKEKLSLIFQEMRNFNIKKGELKFGENNSVITFDKEKRIITSMLASIKGLNQKISEELYDMSNKSFYNSFYDLYKDIYENCSANSAQRKTLVLISYFKDFGKTKKILDFIEYFDIIYKKKQIKKEKCNEFLTNIIKPISSETNTQYKDFDYDKVLYEIWNKLEDIEIDINEQIKYQLEYMGYISVEIPKNISIATVDVVSSKNAWVKLISARDNKEAWFCFEKKPKKHDIIKILPQDIEVKRSDYRRESKWVKKYEIIK